MRALYLPARQSVGRECSRACSGLCVCWAFSQSSLGPPASQVRLSRERAGIWSERAKSGHTLPWPSLQASGGWVCRAAESSYARLATGLALGSLSAPALPGGEGCPRQALLRT